METQHNCEMTIDNFPVTEKNYADYKICREMLKHPDFFRLVFFDLPDNESSHLSNAIQAYWNNRLDFGRVSISEFTNDLLSSIQNGNKADFYEKYDSPTILIVEDFHYIAGKEVTQTEFLHLLQRRISEKKLTILFSKYEISHFELTMREDLFKLIDVGMANTTDNQ